MRYPVIDLAGVAPSTDTLYLSYLFARRGDVIMFASMRVISI